MDDKRDLKKEGERDITLLLILGAIVLLITVIIIGFLVRSSSLYR